MRTTPTSSTARAVASLLLRPVDMAWLAAFRVLYGLALAVSMERFIAYGWIDELLVAPPFRFHYWGFAWVKPLSSAAMHGLFWCLVGLALAVATGFAFRITSVLFAIGLSYIQLIDVSTYLNHYYLAALLAWLLAVSPANRAWSVDAWIRRRRRGASIANEEPRVAGAWLMLFRVQVAVVYVFAGLAKAGSDWLVHGQPLGIWLGARTDLPVLGRIFTIEGVPLAMSWCGFLFDATIVVWLSWRKTRPWAYAIVVGFHVLTRLLFDIGMFPIIMSLSALLFFEPDWPRRILHAVRSRWKGSPVNDVTARGPGEATEPRPVPLGTKVALALGALYCALQILVPLRCHLYGGNVLWHEQGMRFSWRVMIRAKGGATTFLVRQIESGREVHVNPRAYLTPFQENEMSSQPDLILQLAHHIHDDFVARDLGPVEVRVDSKVALNGRQGAPFIDPNIDLAAVHDGLMPQPFILPAPREAPPHTRPVR